MGVAIGGLPSWRRCATIEQHLFGKASEAHGNQTNTGSKRIQNFNQPAENPAQPTSLFHRPDA
jgi:hypothetical protein